MSDLIGWLSLPVVPTFADIAKKLADDFEKPALASTKRVNSAMAKSAQEMTASLERQVAASTRKLQDLDNAYEQSVAKRKKQQLDLNAAIAEQTVAEEKYQAALKKGGSGAAELAKLEKAKAKVVDQTIKMEAAEKAVLRAEEKHASQLKDLTETTEKFKQAQADAAKGVSKSKEIFASIGDSFSGIKEKVAGMGGPVGEAAELLSSFKLGPAAGVAAVGAAAVTAAGAVGKMADEVAKSQIDIQNRFGMSADAARDMQGEVADALGSGMGDYQQTAEAVLAIQQSLADKAEHMAGQTASSLADNFMAFSQTFEVGMSEAVSTVDIMLNTGLVKNANEGIDLLTAGFQKVPAALQGEVLDATNEYSKFFANMGISGSQAMEMLVKASEQGQYAIDKTGDAVKEFTLKAVDPAVAETLSKYGVSVEDLAGRVARGGPEAAAAMGDMVNQLLAIPDEGDRAAAAIAAFGTPLEDLSVEQIPTFLEGLKLGGDGMGDFAGASQTMADNTTKSFSGMVASVKGKVHGWAIDTVVELNEWAGKVTSAVLSSNFVKVLTDSFTRAWDFIVSGLGWAKDAILAGWQAITTPFTEAYERIAAPIGRTVETVRNTVFGLWDELTAAFDGSDNGYFFFSKIFGEDQALAILDAADKVGTAFHSLSGAWSEVVAVFQGGDEGSFYLSNIFGEGGAQVVVDGVSAVSDALAGLWDWAQGVWETLQPIAQAVVDFISGALSETFDSLKNTVDSLWGALQTIGESLMSAWGSVFSSVFEAGKNILASVVDTLQTLWTALQPLLDALWTVLWPVL